jgi:hypothetical protein
MSLPLLPPRDALAEYVLPRRGAAARNFPAFDAKLPITHSSKNAILDRFTNFVADSDGIYTRSSGSPPPDYGWLAVALAFSTGLSQSTFQQMPDNLLEVGYKASVTTGSSGGLQLFSGTDAYTNLQWDRPISYGMDIYPVFASGVFKAWMEFIFYKPYPNNTVITGSRISRQVVLTSGVRTRIRLENATPPALTGVLKASLFVQTATSGIALTIYGTNAVLGNTEVVPDKWTALSSNWVKSYIPQYEGAAARTPATGPIQNRGPAPHVSYAARASGYTSLA